MGKKIIIKGADFSANGIKSYDLYEYIYATKKGDGIIIPLSDTPIGASIKPSDLAIEVSCYYTANANTNGELFECLNSSGNPRMKVAKVYNSDVSVSHLTLWYAASNNDAATQVQNVESGIKTILFKDSNIYMNGSKVGSIGTSNDSMTTLSLLSRKEWEGTWKLSHIKLMSNAGEVYLDLYPAKDDRGKVCVFDAISKKYYYGGEGNTLAVE